MQTSVYDVLRDSDQTFIQLVQVKEWLNKGLLDLNARLRLKQDTATGTASAAGVITLPTEFIEVISLWIGSSPVQFPVDDATFESYSMRDTTTPFAILGRITTNFTEIETYPAQEDQDYTLRYVKRPTELSANGDQPTDLTPELADRVIDFARAEAMLKEDDLNQYEIFRERYLEGLPSRPRRQKPGAMTLIPESGPFG